MGPNPRAAANRHFVKIMHNFVTCLAPGICYENWKYDTKKILRSFYLVYVPGKVNDPTEMYNLTWTH